MIIHVNMDYDNNKVQQLNIIDWNQLNNFPKDVLLNILGYLKIEIDFEIDRNEILWLLRLLAHQYLNHKLYYIYPLCYDLYKIIQLPPFKPIKLTQNLVSRQDKIKEANLIEEITI